MVPCPDRTRRRGSPGSSPDRGRRRAPSCPAPPSPPQPIALPPATRLQQAPLPPLECGGYWEPVPCRAPACEEEVMLLEPEGADDGGWWTEEGGGLAKAGEQQQLSQLQPVEEEDWSALLMQLLEGGDGEGGCATQPLLDATTAKRQQDEEDDEEESQLQELAKRRCLSPSTSPSRALPSKRERACHVKQEHEGGGEQEAAAITVIGLLQGIRRKSPHGISKNKARATLLSWQWRNLTRCADTTRGLLLPLAAALRIPLPGRLPPAHQRLRSREEEAEETRGLSLALSPLDSLPPDLAACSVSWCLGRVRIWASERFSASFMTPQALHEGVMANAESVHRVWARLFPGSLRGYWELVMRAALLEGPKHEPNRPPSDYLLVRDRFGHRSWSTCRLCVYSSPSGWYSCTYIIIQPGPPQGLQH